MKRRLMAFAAIAAFSLPILVPVSVMAQDLGDRGFNDVAQAPQRDRGRPGSSRAASAPETPRSETRRGGQEPRAQASRERSQERPEGSRPRREDTPQDRANRASGGVDRAMAGQNRQERSAPERSRDMGAPVSESRNTERQERRRGSGDERRAFTDQNTGWQDNRGQDRARRDRDSPRTRDEMIQDRADRASGGVDRANGREYQPERRDRQTGGWNNNDNRNWNSGSRDRHSGFNRDRSHRDYRNRFDSRRWQRDWNRSHRSDWWRNDHRFRGWNGVRLGFYFAPGYGYYSVPRSYWGQRYFEGQYLPSIFWRYQMNDWRTYGLGFPPIGTRWVYVDNTVYLIDEYDGYIIDVVRDFWRW